MTKQCKKNQGYTLIEVLISIMFIGMATVLIIGLLSSSIKNNRASKEIMNQTVYGKNIMESIKHELPKLDLNNKDLIALSSTLENKYPGCKILLEENTSISNLYIVDILIEGHMEGRGEYFTSQIYIFKEGMYEETKK